MSRTRYSDCHFAEVMFDGLGIVVADAESTKCSFCGEPCQLIPMALNMEHDLELTLRRWKDGDCTLGDMFNRVNTELERSYLQAFGAAAKTLRGNERPMYKLDRGTIEWKKVEQEGSISNAAVRKLRFPRTSPKTPITPTEQDHE